MHVDRYYRNGSLNTHSLFVHFLCPLRKGLENEHAFPTSRIPRVAMQHGSGHRYRQGPRERLLFLNKKMRLHEEKVFAHLLFSFLEAANFKLEGGKEHTKHEKREHE